MYATEKYVKMEVKELRESINSLGTDLGGDIRYLHQEITQLQEEIQALRDVISFLRSEESNE